MNETKMEQEQHKTIKNDWMRRNSLRSGEMRCACMGVTGVYEVWRCGGEREREGWECGWVWDGRG